MTRKPPGYRVLRGFRGAKARQQYLDYLAGLVDVSPDDGTVSTNRPPSRTLYLTPFGLPLAVDHIMMDSALQPSWDLVKALAPVNTRVAESPGADTPVDIRSYKAPRVIRIQLDTTGETRRSKRTGLPYTYYNNQSSSVPFGAKTGDTTISGAFADIRAVLDSATVNVRLVDERL
jgi:hypothetical protein